MSGNGSKPDHEGLAAAIARALKPQFDGIGDRIDGLGDRIDGLGERIDGVSVRLDRMNLRMDQVVENTGGHYRRLEDRIARLETKVFAPDDDE